MGALQEIRVSIYISEREQSSCRRRAGVQPPPAGSIAKAWGDLQRRVEMINPSLASHFPARIPSLASFGSRPHASAAFTS